MRGLSQTAPPFAIPPALQITASSRTGETLRLCPNALKVKDHGIACGKEKRLLLGVPCCRDVYDQGVSFLKGGDIQWTYGRCSGSRRKH